MTDAAPRHQASLLDSARGPLEAERVVWCSPAHETLSVPPPRLALHHLLNAVREGDEGASWRRGHGEELVPLPEWLYDASLV